jgi:uncharacterized membrane protein (DUF2068 family)
MNRKRLFRLAVVCDVTIALFVGVLSGTELYIIRTGHFRNSNWVEPNAWARTQEWGLLFCVLCIISGYGLWRVRIWARWLELLLVLPKVYCGYFELWIYKMSESLLFLVITFLIVISIASTVLLWLPTRSVESTTSTAN